MKGWRNSLTQPHGEEAPLKGESPFGSRKKFQRRAPAAPGGQFNIRSL